MSVENKLESVTKIDSDKTEKLEEKTVAPIEILDDSQSSQTLDIALPDEQSEIENIEASAIPDPGGDRGEPEKEVPIAEEEEKIDIDVTLSTKSRSPSPRQALDLYFTIYLSCLEENKGIFKIAPQLMEQSHLVIQKWC